MRRGLMVWDKEELPLSALTARVARLQAALLAHGFGAILLYTNFIRSAAVSYITGFSPYWADGVLTVPAEGEPVFATTLSKRVGNWIETVKPIGGLVNSPAPGAIIGKQLAAKGIGRLAILELDAFPAGLYNDIAKAIPGVEITEGGSAFAEARQCDETERRLLARADAITRAALGRVTGVETSAGDALAAAEQYARANGAEEIYLAIATDLGTGRTFLRQSGPRQLGDRFALRATLAYKGVWVRRAQTYARDANGRATIARADAWFGEALSAIDPARPFSGEIAARCAQLTGARLEGWLAESPRGTRPLHAAASMQAPATAGAISPLILSLDLTVDGVPWSGAGLGAQ